LPGVVLAVAQPSWQFVLLDSNSKKTSFVQQVIIELGLRNVVVYCSRVEKWQTTERFDGIISRAFSGLGEFIERTRHLMDERGRWAAMKGIAERELASVPQGCRVERVIALQVPGLSAARSLILGNCKGLATI
jgi:16S rRNA (guanine527-N7)-methyltransferase